MVSKYLRLSPNCYCTLSKFGKNVEKNGIYVINNNTMIATTKNGMMPRETANKFDPDIPLATNKFSPTGGVNNPIAKLTVMKTPKTVGSISKCKITGSKIGTNM